MPRGGSHVIGQAKASLEQRWEATPLQHAVAMGHLEVVRRLAAAGARLRRKDREGAAGYSGVFKIYNGLERSIRRIKLSHLRPRQLLRSSFVHGTMCLKEAWLLGRKRAIEMAFVWV